MKHILSRYIMKYCVLCNELSQLYEEEGYINWPSTRLAKKHVCNEFIKVNIYLIYLYKNCIYPAEGYYWERGSIVSIAVRLGARRLRDCRSIQSWDRESCLFIPKHGDWLWGLASLTVDGYRDLNLWVIAAGA